KCWKNGKLTTYLPGDYGSDRPGAIYEHNGSLWIAVRNGLLRFNNGAFDVLTNTEAQAKLGLVLSMAADHEGDLWLGSEANGLARLRCVAVRVLTAEDGLAENSTRCVFRDSHGDIWIGSYLGFSRLSHGKLTAYTTIDGHPIPTVTSIAEDLQGRLWIAAGGRLLVRQDGHLSPLPEWTSVFDIKVIARDNRGEMWIGTDGDGLFRYSQGKFTVYRKRDGLGSGQIRAILGERDGTLWIGTTAGLSRYENGVFTNFTTADGLANNRVMSLLKDDEGCLWVGTRGGLSRYHDGHFSNITEKDGLPNDYVFNVLDDRRGNFWLSTPAGISAARKTDLDALADGKKQKINVASLGYRDGLRSSSLVAGTVPNACRDDEGQLMFCSLKGLVIVNPQNQLPNGEIPPVYIESVLINKHPVPVDQPVALPPGGGELEIHYTALSYVAPEKVLFRYRLDGIDTAWVDAGKRRFAHYAHLPPGTYRFRVIACNNDGVWNEAGARFAFRLPPHFYQTKWFDAAVGLGIIGLTAGWYRLRIRRLQDEETELRRRVDEAVAQVRVLSGLLPICSGCRKIRDDKGYWSRIENYISKHADVKFSHSLCPDCLQRLYPDYADGLITSVKTPESPGFESFK
ncbi:MAG TPA: two-component regulator propeller domain-containing protein, partial [Verrucomicrobiae bacterium]|nr:two-component regulator propeller domain-containing protein [Verrucomicrobiae bacterium]